MRKLFVLCIFIITLFSISAFAALPVTLGITGASQGAITSDTSGVYRQQWMQNNVVVYAMSGQIASKGDKTLTLTKEIDKASPNLFSALLSDEKLTINMNFHKVGPTGQVEHYFTMKIENARVMAIELNYPYTFVSANSVFPHLEDITIKFDKATLVHETSGTGSGTGTSTGTSTGSGTGTTTGQNEGSQSGESQEQGQEESQEQSQEGNPEVEMEQGEPRMNEVGIGEMGAEVSTTQGMEGEPSVPHDEPRSEEEHGQDLGDPDMEQEGMHPEEMPEGMSPEEWRQIQQEQQEGLPR